MFGVSWLMVTGLRFLCRCEGDLGTDGQLKNVEEGRATMIAGRFCLGCLAIFLAYQQFRNTTNRFLYDDTNRGGQGDMGR